MEKRSRRRTRDLVTQPASQGLSENEIGCVRISMMARSINAPLKGRIQKRKTNHLQIIRSHCNTRIQPVLAAGRLPLDPKSGPEAVGSRRRVEISQRPVI